MYDDDFLNKKLQEREAQDAYRKLRLPGGKIDLCSNDHLGIAKNNLLLAQVDHGSALGSTGSRSLAGNYKLIEETEKEIALFHGSRTALIFNSGFNANIGVLASVPQRGDTIIYDALCHASIRDGIRLSFANSFSFAHNDIADLEQRLQNTSGNIFIVTETVFSMDGDLCPLQAIVQLCKRYHAHLIIDEAHATGVIGLQGEGFAQHLGLQNEIFCRIHTFGKACGCHGAVVLGSQRLRDHLINFARSFIYTTSLPAAAVAAIGASYKIFPTMVNERAHLQELSTIFQKAEIEYERPPSQTPIQILIVPGNGAVRSLAERLQQNGFDIRPILYPSVPKGRERLRIVVHAFNTKEEIRSLIGLLRK